jgi:HEAT repeat protein
MVVSRRSYKTDVSFLEKISIGAVGTRRVFEDMCQQGHAPIELERGSMSFKIWKNIKIKRIRVPDLLCVDCGRRVESRAKTKLEISMSHSFSNPERGWDYGLEDEDLVALVVCRRAGDRPIDWKADDWVQYVLVKELRSDQQADLVLGVSPKGAEEGFEARITWPASIASAAGVVERLTEERLQYRRRTDSRMITLKLSRRGISLKPVVQEGDVIVANQVLASVVPVTRSLPCSNTVSEKDYIVQLESSSLSERYAASKALSYFNSAETVEALSTRVADIKDHVYIRLEAAASLARCGDKRGVAFIGQCLSDQYLQNRLEAVVVLGEVGSQAANRMLVDTLRDDNQHPEIRAGAAWALGELRDGLAIDVLITSFVAMEAEIRTEAARALAKLATRFTQEIVDEFSKGEPLKRPGIAWALSKSARFSVEQLLETLVDDDARRWVAYIIGSQESQSYIRQIEALRLKDPEVYFAVTVLWQIMSSWIYGLEEYG